MSPYAIVEGDAVGLADVTGFLDAVSSLDQHPSPEIRGLFDPGQEVVITRAPGRLDLMGGIADYSGSLVLQWPLQEATFAALQLADDGRIRIVSLATDGKRDDLVFEMPMAALTFGGRALSYDDAWALFRRDPAQHWAAYAAGALVALAHEQEVALPKGLRLLVRSDVPEGKGVSSSAAIEVAVMQALATALGLDIDAREVAILCQTVENRVVGAPCGVMDQMASACGRAGELLALLCQPAELLGTVAMPAELGVWGLDSGVRHAVTGSDYGRVRVGAFMGARILADLAGLAVRPGARGGRVEIDDTRWWGYLANVTPSEWAEFASRVPEEMNGAAFLERYGGTADAVTTVDPNVTYAVRRPTAHPIHECFRVRTFAELLVPPLTPRRRELLGELMYQSHRSYSACGLGSPGTDRIVALVRAAGRTKGFYGAKITGGGSGGTVAVLTKRGTDIESIADAYAAETGHRPVIFSGSSPGAGAFGHLRVRRNR